MTESILSIRLARGPLLALAMANLVAGVWGGLARLHWSPVPLTTWNVNWVSFHGPLMVCGFLGTVITLERASAVGRWWAYSGPVLTGAGGLWMASGRLGSTPLLLFVFGSALVSATTASYAWRHRSFDLGVMTSGAAAWFVGNVELYFRRPVPHVVVWWIAFLMLTVVAERLELSRFLRPTRRQWRMMVAAIGTFVVGVIARETAPAWGDRVAGAGMIAVAAWLIRYDMARRAIAKPGLPRFMAICLIAGYGWLGIAGGALAFHAPLPDYGGPYDAALHAFFLGFVVSMIFGHAMIILPAVMRIDVPFRRAFYGHLILLHLSVAARIAGDLLLWPRWNGMGGLGASVALALFVLATGGSVVFSFRRT